MVAPTSFLRRVACPCCGTESLFSGKNPHRPFCSERCRKIDLGAWASESFRVATEAPPEDAAGDAGLQ